MDPPVGKKKLEKNFEGKCVFVCVANQKKKIFFFKKFRKKISYSSENNLGIQKLMKKNFKKISKFF